MHRRWLPWILSATAMACGDNTPTMTADAAAVDDVALDMVTAPDAVTQDVVAPGDVVAPQDVAAMTDAVAPRDVVAPQDVVDVATVDRASPVDAVTADVVTADATADAAIAPYPAGPYGNTAGRTLASLSWEGYVNPDGDVVSNTLAYGPTSLQALRTGRGGYGVVHVSEFY